MSERPGIIVLGVPRSGTTLLRRLIDAHPNIACPPETNLLSATSRFLDEHEFAGGMSVGVIPGLHFSGFDEDTVLRRTREFVTGFFREIAAKHGKPRWAEKTAADIFHLDRIERLLGDSCTFIGVLRHPLDVIASIKDLSDKMESYLPELHSYVAQHLSPAEAFGHAWADATSRLLRFAEEHPSNTLLVKYEDLTKDPRAEMTRVFEFLQEPCDVDAVLADALNTRGTVGLGDWKTYEARAVSTSSVGRHGRVDPSLLARLAPRLNPVMAQCGYPPLAAKGAVQGAEARRRYEFSLRVAGLKPQSNERTE